LINNKLYIILGGGIQDSGKLPDHVISRLDLVSSMAGAEDLILTSSSFSLNVPPKLDKDRYPIFESVQMAKVLKERGFKNLITENWSHDTIGSAIFCRMLIDSLQLNSINISVITSDFHFKRTSEIFSWAFNNLKPIYNPIEVIFSKSPKEYQADIKKRVKKEKEASMAFNSNFRDIKLFKDALKKLLVSHDNYNLKHTSSNRNLSKITMY
tara:strand:+ start:2217 stop:2849 length:633 start_codon:yes stop_codon:yes gene_type:complete